MLSTLLALLLSGLGEPACRTVEFEAVPFVVCEAARDADIRLLRAGTDPGAPFTLQRAVESLPEADRARVAMAMNAGMYHPDRAPVGLFVSGGKTAAPLVTRAGPGNFGMLPNGVFWSDGRRVHVTESRRFADDGAVPDFATQSGPMLVVQGALHPRFRADSTSRRRRNGVGVGEDRVVFAISDAPVTFHHFARLFRDELGTPDALYLDGSVSRIHAPDIGRSERGGAFGPVVVLLGGDREEGGG